MWKKVNRYYINLIPSPSLSSFHNLPHGEVDTKYLGGYHGYSIWKGNINIKRIHVYLLSTELFFLQGAQQMAGLGDLRGVFEPLADNYQQLCQLSSFLPHVHSVQTNSKEDFSSFSWNKKIIQKPPCKFKRGNSFIFLSQLNIFHISDDTSYQC